MSATKFGRSLVFVAGDGPMAFEVIRLDRNLVVELAFVASRKENLRYFKHEQKPDTTVNAGGRRRATFARIR